MSWWLRSHSWLFSMLAWVVLASISALVGSYQILFPAITGGAPFAGVPLYAVIPLVGVTVLSVSLSRAEKATYRVAVRRVDLLDYALTVSFTVVTAAATAAIASVTHTPDPWWTLRNAVGFVGLQWLVGPWLGYRYQSVIPALFVFVAAIFGRGSEGGEPAVWAWPISPGSVSSWAIAGLTLLVGFALTATNRFRRRSTLSSHP